MSVKVVNLNDREIDKCLLNPVTLVNAENIERMNKVVHCHAEVHLISPC